MNVRWTRPAKEDLAAILRHIRQDDHVAAQRVAKRILEEAASLKTMSERGRPGTIAGTREIVFAPWPYILVYEVQENQVLILTVRHAARNWPSQ